MTEKKRVIEVFTAGCPLCVETVRLVTDATCPSCDVRVLDLRTDPRAVEKARAYGVTRAPAVVIDGKVASCCSTGGVDLGSLRGEGLGVQA